MDPQTPRGCISKYGRYFELSSPLLREEVSSASELPPNADNGSPRPEPVLERREESKTGSNTDPSEPPEKTEDEPLPKFKDGGNSPWIRPGCATIPEANEEVHEIAGPIATTCGQLHNAAETAQDEHDK